MNHAADCVCPWCREDVVTLPRRCATTSADTTGRCVLAPRHKGEHIFAAKAVTPEDILPLIPPHLLYEEELEKAAELRHWTHRMLQALDIYWLHYEGYNGPGEPRSMSTEEDWWHRFEKYRRRVEALLKEEP